MLSKKILLLSSILIGFVLLSIYSYKKYRTYKENVHINTVITHYNLTPATPIDYICHLVHRYSHHILDKEFWRTFKNYTKVTQIFANNACNKSTKVLHAECSLRTKILQHILQNLGHTVRTLILYNENTLSHTLLEVYNHHKNTWELYDPDYNIYWWSIYTQNKASSLDILKHITVLKKNYIPCRYSSACTWHLRGNEKQDPNILPPFFQAIYINEGQGKLYIHNKKKAALQKKICKKHPKHCKGSIIAF